MKLKGIIGLLTSLGHDMIKMFKYVMQISSILADLLSNNETKKFNPLLNFNFETTFFL